MKKARVSCMRPEVFEELLEYSHSLPTSPRVGFRWRALNRGGWWLGRITGTEPAGRDRFNRPTDPDTGQPVGNPGEDHEWALITWTRIAILVDGVARLPPY